MAKDADPGWEVVTVRPSDPNGLNSGFRVEGRHVSIGRKTVEAMLMVAYGLQKDQIMGEPGWAKTESFDVDGVPDTVGEPNLQQLQILVRKVLEERFRLKGHKEQREMAVFALRPAKSGPKMTPSESDPNALPGEDMHGGDGERHLDFTQTSMQELALTMQYLVDRPVVDQTRLKGRYDFKLSYTYDDQKAPTDGSAPPSLFTAIQEQMGLKLESVRAPADVLVVDSVERSGAN